MKMLKWEKLNGTGYTSWVIGISKTDLKIVRAHSTKMYRLRVEGVFIDCSFKKLSTAKQVAQLIHNG